MKYTIELETKKGKAVQWDRSVPGSRCPGDGPNLAEIIAAARAEFPDVKFEDLTIENWGYDGEILVLVKRLNA